MHGATSKNLHEFNEKFDQLVQYYNQALVERTSNAARSLFPALSRSATIDDLNARLMIVEQYEALLTKQKHELDFEHTLLSLYNLIKQQQALATRLQLHHQLTVTKFSFNDLEKLKATIQTKTEETCQEIARLKPLLQQFNQYLKAQTLLQALTTITTQEQQLEVASQSTNAQLGEIKLSIARQTELDEELAAAPETTHYIALRQEALTEKQSYKNPQAWLQWAQEKDFYAQLEQKKIELNYLKLIVQQKQQLNQRQVLQHEKLALTEICTQQLGFPQGESERPNLAITLSGLPQPAEQNDHQYFEQLTNHQSTLENQQLLDQACLQQLEELQTLATKDLEIRCQLLQTFGTEYLAPTEAERLKLQQSQEQYTQKIAEIQAQTETCAQCRTFLIKLSSLNDTKKKPRKKNRTTLIDLELDSQQAKINGPNHMPPVQEKSLTVDCNQTTTTIVDTTSLASKSHAYHQQMASWHEQINLLKTHLPHALSSWYDQLYTTLTDTSLDLPETHQLQALQLLRDIHCELFYTPNNQHQSVLEAYHQQCPNPSIHYQHLLELKPALPLIAAAQLPALQDPKIKNQINKLYRQQHRLQRDYPKEAAVLEQAVINLHQMAANLSKKQSFMKPTFFPNDPRYNCLHQHRGLGKVGEWLAQLCTTLLNKLHLTRNDDYRQRFFFSKTKTTQLLEKAEVLISP